MPETPLGELIAIAKGLKTEAQYACKVLGGRDPFMSRTCKARPCWKVRANCPVKALDAWLEAHEKGEIKCSLTE